MNNEMFLEFDAISSNESFARVAVAAFISSLNPTLEEVSDVKTAVSEAVTNAVIHGYENICDNMKKIQIKKDSYKTVAAGKESTETVAAGKESFDKVIIHCMIYGDVLHIEVRDSGKGIEDIEQAMEPLFTTKPELERSGMGFAFMEAFMDDLEVESTPGQGTSVFMKKKIGSGSWIPHED